MEIYPIVQVINQETGLEFWTNIVGQTNEYQSQNFYEGGGFIAIYSILGKGRGGQEDTL